MAEFPCEQPPELSDINYIIRSLHPRLNDLPMASHCSYNQDPSRGSPSLGRFKASSPSLTGSSYRNLFFNPPDTPSWFPPLSLCFANPTAQGCLFSRLLHTIWSIGSRTFLDTWLQRTPPHNPGYIYLEDFLHSSHLSLQLHYCPSSPFRPVRVGPGGFLVSWYLRKYRHIVGSQQLVVGC